MSRQTIDLRGKRFGRLTVLQEKNNTKIVQGE